MVIYNKNSQATPYVTIPVPCGYKMDLYDVVVTDTSTGEKFTYHGIKDEDNLSDFLVFNLANLNNMPLGDYIINVNDGYSTVAMRIQSGDKPTYHKPDITTKEVQANTTNKIYYNG